MAAIVDSEAGSSKEVEEDGTSDEEEEDEENLDNPDDLCMVAFTAAEVNQCGYLSLSGGN